MQAIIEFVMWLLTGYAIFMLWVIGIVLVVVVITGFLNWRLSKDKKELQYWRALYRYDRSARKRDIEEARRRGFRF